MSDNELPADPFDDFLSGALAPDSVQQQVISLVLSPFDSVAALKAALELVGAKGSVVDLGGTAAVYLKQEEAQNPQDEAMMALLGEDRPVPEPVDKVARLVSKLSAKGAVALTAWVRVVDADPEAGSPSPELTGNIAARRYVGGEPEEKLSGGLVLARLNLVAEELLLGRVGLQEVDEWLQAANWSGWLSRFFKKP